MKRPVVLHKEKPFYFIKTAPGQIQTSSIKYALNVHPLAYRLAEIHCDDFETHVKGK